jgi:hypothetical protein
MECPSATMKISGIAVKLTVPAPQRSPGGADRFGPKPTGRSPPRRRWEEIRYGEPIHRF